MKKPTASNLSRPGSHWKKWRCPLPEHAPASVLEHSPLRDHHPALAHHFDDLDQQHEAAELGMWLFLVTEFMFFGGLFLAYLVYRHAYPNQFALGSRSMDVMLGTINTGVLLTSSLTMALAVDAARHSRRGPLVLQLLATIALGTIFLGIKAYEYHHKYEHHEIPFAGLPFLPGGSVANQPGLATFFNLYFLMTGLHAVHMVIGIAILFTLTILALRGGLLAERSIIVHNTGLY